MDTVELDRLLTLFEAGQLSAPLTVARLVLVARDVTEVERWLVARGAAGGAVSHELLRLIEQHRCGCEHVASLAGAFDPVLLGERLPTGGMFEHSRLGASAAPYSLCEARQLERATCELVEQLRNWGLLGEDRRALEIGCRAGRVQRALAPSVRLAAGVDEMPRMVARARARCAGLRNTRHEVASGDDLRSFGSGTFDLVYAVDAFPEIVKQGDARVSGTFEEVARVLAPRAELLIFNYSRRGDIEADAQDIDRLARAHGFDVLCRGERPFRIWDGVVFRLRKAAAASPS